MSVGITACAAMLSAQQSPVPRALTEPWPTTEKIDGIEIVPVLKHVYMLVGAGANVTVQIGEQGVTMVDAGTTGRADALLAAVGHLTSKPVRYLIDTGSDADHIGGSAAIVKAAGGVLGGGTGGAGAGGGGGRGNAAPNQNVGVMTMSHENAANRLSRGGAGLPALTGDAIPFSTFFTRRKDLYLNGEPIELRWEPAAHTDGDIFVFFRGSDVVSVGDVYLPDSYPHIDLARGGSVQGEIDALNAIIDITVPERNQMGGTRVVPGHGRLANEADVVEYRNMVTIVRDRVRDMVKKSMTVEQVKAAKPTLEYDGIYGTDKNWTGAMFIETVYRDLSQKKGGGK
jgi:glyoxylase-like metal-dependent hydrolase (beta-lactamase superfamily II)